VTFPPTNPSPDNAARLLHALQQLLTIQSVDLRSTLTEASTLVGEAVNAEKVDVFLYEARSHSLVAMGTSTTPLGHRQHALGLDRMPLVNNGPTVAVFQTGDSYCTGRADLDPEQPRGVIHDLGIRSQIDVPLSINGERRGVLAAASPEIDRFSEDDVAFLQAVAHWIGMMTHREELVERRQHEAVARGRREAGDELARLTPRHRELATLIAEGLSNEAIAERLVLTPGTVANHLRSILQRLGFDNRVQVAVWAVERGLYRSLEPGDAGAERDGRVMPASPPPLDSINILGPEDGHTP
jgi:DNA-binding CsgD family transcriptional regulator